MVQAVRTVGVVAVLMTAEVVVAVETVLVVLWLWL